VNTAADDANNAAATLRRASYYALIAVVVACLVFMGATWAVTRWKTEGRRAEAAELEKRIAAMSTTAEILESKTGGGVELVRFDNGTRGVILPAGSQIIRTVKMPDGREAIEY